MADRSPTLSSPLREQVTPKQREALRRPRHRQWITCLTDRDWQRLAERADDTLASGHFARIEDLDGRVAVYVAHPANKHLHSGGRLNVLRGCPLLVWDID